MKKYLIIMILSIIATFNAGYLTHLAYSEGESFCDINAKYSCSTSLNSPETSIFGIPFPAFALVVYPVIFFIALRWWRKKGGKQFTFLARLSAGGILFNGYFIYQEYAIGAYCPLCLLCSAIIITIFILSVVGKLQALWNETRQK